MAKISVLLCFIILIAFGFGDCHVVHEKIGIYELKNGNFSAKFTNWGASLVLLFLTKMDNWLLLFLDVGCDSIKDYINIANEGHNTIHGGSRGFSRVAWRVSGYKKGAVPYIQFSYRSFDGEQGFPGDLIVSVTYILIGHDTMTVTMKARALNKPTPVNLAHTLEPRWPQQHLSHKIQIFGSHITPVNRELIPTGKIVPVTRTPYDFLKPHTIGSRIKELPNGYDINYVLNGGKGNKVKRAAVIFGSHITPVNRELIPTGKIVPVTRTPYDFLKPHTIGSRIKELPNGYDINYVLNGGKGNKVKRAAVVHRKKSGRVLELTTNAPGLQFYTSNWNKNFKGKGGHIYKPHAGLCLETQDFPDAVNHPNFPSQIVRRGKPYSHSMPIKFSTTRSSA
nr:aldose 1-epimerase [Quercus suber]